MAAARSTRVRLYLTRMLLDKGYRHPDQDFIGLIRRKGGRAWFDLGAGSNPFVRLLRRHFGSAYGLDADPGYLKRAERPDLLGDIARLPLRDGAATLLTSFMVLEHIADPEGFAGEVARALAPGGEFIFVTVNRGYWGSRLNSLLPEGIKKRLVGLLFRRQEEDIFPASYRLNTLSDIRGRLGSRFDLEVREYRSYYSFSPAFFWIQHALVRAFPRSSLFVSNYLIIGRKRRAPG